MPHDPTRKPAFTEPPHAVSPDGDLVAWFTDPSGILVQVARPVRIEVPHAAWMVGPLQAEALRRYSAASHAVIIIDTTLMTSRDPAVRAMFMESGRQLRGKVDRTILIPPSNASAVYLASLDVASSILQVFGIRMDVVRSLPFVISSLGLRPVGG